MWSGERLTRKQLTSRPDHLWPELWKSMGKHAKLKEKQMWYDEMHENCEGSISTRRTRNSKKPLRMRVRRWKHQWLLLCLVTLWKIVGVVDPTKSKQNLRVFWKPMNPPECVWGILNHIITKTILQEKVRIHCNITIWFTNFSYASSYENSSSKSSSGQGMRKLDKISAWNLTKVRSKKEVIDEARKSGAKVHLASFNGHLSSEKCWIGDKHQKYKGRVVLRGDIVKDNSGSYAVFT